MSAGRPHRSREVCQRPRALQTFLREHFGLNAEMPSQFDRHFAIGYTMSDTDNQSSLRTALIENIELTASYNNLRVVGLKIDAANFVHAVMVCV